MQKILITFIVILLVIGVAIGLTALVLLRAAPTSTTPLSTTGDNSSTGSLGGTSSTGGSVPSSGTNGQDQSGGANSGNFLKAPDTYADPNNAGQYFLAGTTQTPTSTKPYSILYVASDQSFTIGLLEEPIGSTRLAAEQALEKTLGISEAAMCNLNYNVLVPHEINQFYSGKNLGFSFCPGATPLQ